MDRVAQRVLVLLCFVICMVHSQIGISQSFLRADGKEIKNENGESVILRGMGLGGWMLQEGYMLQTASFANSQHKIKQSIRSLIGQDNTELFYEAWLNNHVTKTDIDSLGSWGFNSVRLPMHYDLFTLPIEDEPVPGEQTWLDKGFEMTDNLIAWCKANKMYVILDLHAAPGGQGRDEGISDYNPLKPSLWESEENKQKTIALWKRLAERYANEPVVAGYDLLNETNWAMDGNKPLKDIYLDITAAIREVDQNHIIFVEGNWFANDFTNLTPPWDDNIVYSPHKYWSINDKESIQWVLDIREDFNVPLYFGESGENSNEWFAEAIGLFEENNIGWAWWPMKKIESISGPLSVNKSEGYQRLLDYWNNGGIRPSLTEANAILMQLTEDLKIENCRFQKDVIDAMFRQVSSAETLPFSVHEVPGVIFATDYDLGRAGYAYQDMNVADYRVSTGNFTAWNNGWTYRNDGVDIEPSTDFVNTNGYNVGWLDADEWMQYEINVEESGFYNVNVRVAANDSGGAFHFNIDDVNVSSKAQVSNTGGWQNWETIQLTDIYLDKKDKKLRFYVDNAGFNVGSFKFSKSSNNTSQVANYVTSFTENDLSVVIAVDKPINGDSPINIADFSIQVNGVEVGVKSIDVDDENSRRLIIILDEPFKFSDEIDVSYSGTSLVATDGSTVLPFANKLIENRLDIVFAIPGRIQAEDYVFETGIQLENTTDSGGGQNIGFLDVGDFLEYDIQIGQAGSYAMDVRTAALSESGGFKLDLIDENEQLISIGSFSFPATGGWQDWQTSQEIIRLPEGRFTLRLTITQSLFNVNWLDFNFLTSIKDESFIRTILLYPNPAAAFIVIEAEFHAPIETEIKLIDSSGRLVFASKLNKDKLLKQRIDLSQLTSGIYTIILASQHELVFTDKIYVH